MPTGKGTYGSKSGRPAKKKKSLLTKAKAKVTNTAANILSAPAQLVSRRQIRQSGEDAKAIKLARAYDDSPSIKAAKARTAAEFAKDRTKKRSEKLRKAHVRKNKIVNYRKPSKLKLENEARRRALDKRIAARKKKNK